ncbi:MAG: hypothetical protein LIO65_03180, partial [Odoribacter sp.]|nr:hypothetical protein [Odoribacter sp.]
ADIKQHQLKLYTNKYLKTDKDLIPDGTFVEVKEEYNFCEFQPLENVINKKGGLDDCYIFEGREKIRTQAKLFSPKSGITLKISSDFPGIQVYTGNALDVEGAKNNKHYNNYAGVALEAQYLPDSPHHPEFPSTLLKPGEQYNKTGIYKFNKV